MPNVCVPVCVCRVCASSSNGNSYYHQNSPPPPKLPPWKLRPKTLGFNNRVDQFVLLFVCVFDQYRPNRIYFWFAFRFLFSVTKPFHMTATLHDDTGTLHTNTIPHRTTDPLQPTATAIGQRYRLPFHRLPSASTAIAYHRPLRRNHCTWPFLGHSWTICIAAQPRRSWSCWRSKCKRKRKHSSAFTRRWVVLRLLFGIDFQFKCSGHMVGHIFSLRSS